MPDNQQVVVLQDDAILAGAPGEVDIKRKRKPREVSAEPRTRKRRANGDAGTKLQTQVPKEWRESVSALAKAQGVRESDVVRSFIARGLGIE